MLCAVYQNRRCRNFLLEHHALLHTLRESSQRCTVKVEIYAEMHGTATRRSLSLDTSGSVTSLVMRSRLLAVF